MAIDFKVAVTELKTQQYSSVRVVILTGEGKAFSAGGDLDMLLGKTTLSADENHRRMIDFYNSFLCIRDLGIPIIAAINGAAVGAGLCVAIACHLRIAAKSAKLGFTFSKLGLHPGMAATFFLPKVVGPAKAEELLLTARIFSAEEGHRIGLINELVDDGNAVARAIEVAQEILLTGKEVTKQLLSTLANPLPTLAESLEREASSQSINYSGVEFLEGITAAKEKRKAKF